MVKPVQQKVQTRSQIKPADTNTEVDETGLNSQMLALSPPGSDPEKPTPPEPPPCSRPPIRAHRAGASGTPSALPIAHAACNERPGVYITPAAQPPLAFVPFQDTDPQAFFETIEIDFETENITTQFDKNRCFMKCLDATHLREICELNLGPNEFNPCDELNIVRSNQPEPYNRNSNQGAYSGGQRQQQQHNNYQPYRQAVVNNGLTDIDVPNAKRPGLCGSFLSH